jgi:hypothetical protein
MYDKNEEKQTKKTYQVELIRHSTMTTLMVEYQAKNKAQALRKAEREFPSDIWESMISA